MNEKRCERPSSKKVSDVFGKYKREGQPAFSVDEMNRAVEAYLRAKSTNSRSTIAR